MMQAVASVFGKYLGALCDVDIAEFDRAVELATEVRARRGHVYFIGNGGSAAIASHMAIDWMNKAGFASHALNDPAALTCIANDYGYVTAFRLQLRHLIRNGDLIVAISSSGESKSILGTIMPVLPAEHGTITLTGFDPGNALRKLGNANIYVPSSDYGVVETAHLAILHAMLDRMKVMGDYVSCKPCRYVVG